MSSTKRNRKTLIIGLDGATFDIINPLIASGKLPNISRLINEGSYGVLQSSLPPLSPTAWSSFMTGTNPAKHGILDFFSRQPDSYMAKFNNATSRREKTFWAIAGEHNRKVGIINVPATYPPDKVNGFMISGMDTPGTAQNYIYPPELEEELKREVGGYKLEEINLRTTGDNSESWLKKLYDTLENRFVVTKYLMQKHDWDLFVVVFESTDRIQHSCWEDEKPPKPPAGSKKKGNRQLVNEVYEKVDHKLGALLDSLDEEVLVVVLSDHGFGPVNHAVRLNFWLARQGDLHFKLAPHGIKYSLDRAKVRVKELFRHRIYRNFKKITDPNAEVHKINKRDLLPNVDWGNTKAYCLGGTGNIFINLKGREPAGIVEPGEEYESVVDELIEKLKGFTDPLTGNNVFSHVYKRNEVYKGKLIEEAPDILLDWAYGYSFIGERERFILKIKNYDEQDVFIPHQWAGNHLPNGIIIFHGKDINKGVELKDANIVDVAPTVLYLMGLPISSNMDGQVLTSAIKDDFLKSYSVKLQETAADQTVMETEPQGYSEEEAELIKKKLQDLGYME